MLGSLHIVNWASSVHRESVLTCSKNRITASLLSSPVLSTCSSHSASSSQVCSNTPVSRRICRRRTGGKVGTGLDFCRSWSSGMVLRHSPGSRGAQRGPAVDASSYFSKTTLLLLREPWDRSGPQWRQHSLLSSCSSFLSPSSQVMKREEGLSNT